MQARDYKGPARNPARGSTLKGKMVPPGRMRKLNKLSKKKKKKKKWIWGNVGQIQDSCKIIK